MLLFFVVLAQADVTNQRVQAIIAGLMVVAASLALLTAWYWRVTDPRRRVEPQPSAPTSDDAFVPVETKPKRIRGPLSSDDPDGGGAGLAESGPDGTTGGEESGVGATRAHLGPDDLTGDVTILGGPETDATLDLRLVEPTPAYRPLEPLPPRPAPGFIEVERPRDEAVEEAEIDLRQPAPEPEPADRSDGLSVDEWLSLKAGD